MKILIDQSGMVAESDKLLLSQSLFIHKHLLIDKVLFAKHKLHPKTEPSIKKLSKSTTVSEWMDMAKNRGLTNEEIMDILLFLNQIGALVVKHNLKSFIQVNFRRAINLRHGVWPIRPSRRWKSSIWGIGWAVWSTMLPLIPLIIVTGLAAYGIYITVNTIIINSIYFLFLIWVSTVAHEYVHIKIVALEHLPSDVFKKGLRIGILHKPLSYKHEIQSAIYGPLVGVIFSIVIGLSLNFIFDNKGGYVTIALIVSSFHLFSYLPAYGDGQVIWRRARRIYDN